jgi:hypothetical protein
MRKDAKEKEGFGTDEFAPRVKIDGAYPGGERTGGKVGRGAENKVNSLLR